MASYAYTFVSGDTVTPTKLNDARTISNIVNADVSATAAIAGTKIAPDFGSQNISVSGGGRLIANATNNPLALGTNGIERIRIHGSGGLSIGTTEAFSVASGGDDGFSFAGNGTASFSRDNNPTLQLRRRSGNGSIATFYRDTTNVGTISVTTTATAYNTSSDYRLKQNVEPMVGGLAKLAALAPKTFEFRAEPNVKVDGFIAHEVQAVVPQAVTGEKDGEEMQGLDHSKLVPVLVAAVQELAAKVTALESAQ
jgi:hypothetical protein